MEVTTDAVETALKNVEARLNGWAPEQLVADDIRSRLREPDVDAYREAHPCTRAAILRGVYYGDHRRFAGEPAIFERDDGSVRVYVGRYDRYCRFDSECNLDSDGWTPRLLGPLADNPIESCVLAYLFNYEDDARTHKDRAVLDLPEYAPVAAMLSDMGVKRGKYELYPDGGDELFNAV